MLRNLKVRRPECMGIILTGYASLESAVEAIRQGAYDYLVKPCDLEDLKLTVRGAAERRAVARETQDRLIQQESSLEEMRAFIHDLRRDLDHVAAELKQKTQELSQALSSLQQVRLPHIGPPEK